MLSYPQDLARAWSSPSPQEAALAYAEAGWAVLPVAGIADGNCTCGRPCDNRAKHPLTRHGVHDSSNQPTQVRRWWRRWPHANVGIATGARSALTVVDVDLHRDGHTSLELLRTVGCTLPLTYMAYTGGGGFHLFYRQPLGMTVPNTVGRLPNVCAALPGIDLRGDGGYVVAAPSLHVSGRRYQWCSRQPDGLALLPEWLWSRPPPPPSSGGQGARRHRPSGSSPYGAAALAREVEAVRGLVKGGRNDGLNRSAFALGTLVAGGELTEEVVHRELVAAAVAGGLGFQEANRTVGSGLRAGAGSPRTAPQSRRRTVTRWRDQP